MAVIYSSAALKTRQREVKDAARENVVHITENGNAAYVLLSEELYEAKLAEAREEAAYAERMRSVLIAGAEDRAQGRVISGTDHLFAAIDEIRDNLG
ncbi:MAG: hypothetical protein J6D54_09685 [Olsenella sp.]|nr:hypothetical protein [Olsenella sp.]